jgi:hypothetical protein
MGGREKDGKEGAKDNKVEEDAEERAVKIASEGPSETGHQGEKATRGSRLWSQERTDSVAKTN